jgi:hypothetical protein
MGVTAAVAVAGLIFYMVRKGGKETPATLTREWRVWGERGGLRAK